MPMTRLLTAAVLLALAATAAAQDKTKKLYCWNENGRKVCGDALPADAAARARTEISSKSGLRTGEIARTLTGEERIAAAAAAAEAARLAEEVAARKRRDLAMIESYATEAELMRAFQERIDLLDETVKASQLGVANLRLSLLSLLRQAGERELAGKPVTPTMAGNIQTQHAELNRQQAILATQQRDRASLDGDLADALARYRAMKQPTGVAAPTPAPVPAPPPNG